MHSDLLFFTYRSIVVLDMLDAILYLHIIAMGWRIKWRTFQEAGKGEVRRQWLIHQIFSSLAAFSQLKASQSELCDDGLYNQRNFVISDILV